MILTASFGTDLMIKKAVTLWETIQLLGKTPVTMERINISQSDFENTGHAIPRTWLQIPSLTNFFT